MTIFKHFLFAIFLLTSSKAFAEQKLKVGMLVTLSGSFSAVGEDCRKGAEAAKAVLGDKDPLELVFADSKNEPATAISEFQKLLQIDKVLGIYTMRSSIGMALDPISQRAGMPLLGAVGHKDFTTNNPFAIQIWPRSDDEGRFYAEEFLKRGYKNVAMLYTEDEWTSSVSDSFREEFKKNGGNLVYDQPGLPAVTDFRTQLAQIKSKSPDAVYMNMLLPQVAPVIKQARELGVGGHYYSNFYVAKKEVLTALGSIALENVRYVEFDTDLPKLRTLLDPNQQISPAGLTVTTYVATLLFAQVANEDKNISNANELMAALNRQTEVKTPDRVYPIENRYVKLPLVVKLMHNGSGMKENS